MMNRGVRRYAVTMRSLGRLIYNVEVEAEDAFLAHRQARALFPDRTIVKITLLPDCVDGEDW
jgi:hypothetical protein